MVAEYERAVIFRLGRLSKGGSKGPGIFTVIPCIDTYRCVDLRTVSFDVPPQEVIFQFYEFLNDVSGTLEVEKLFKEKAPMILEKCSVSRYVIWSPLNLHY